MKLKEYLESIELEYLKAALEKYPSNYAAAADEVGMLRTTFLARLKKFGLYEKRGNPRRDYSGKASDSDV
jgi:DNA-binding NtrC family response regulator